MPPSQRHPPFHPMSGITLAKGEKFFKANAVKEDVVTTASGLQ